MLPVRRAQAPAGVLPFAVAAGAKSNIFYSITFNLFVSRIFVFLAVMLCVSAFTGGVTTNLRGDEAAPAGQPRPSTPAPLSQKPETAWSFRVWQSDDGLPNNRVTSLAQTPDGYLWIATPTRLARFDGDRVESILRDVYAPGTAQRTSMLLRSRNGGLWLAMDHGPVIYAKGETAMFTNGLPDEIVQSLAETPDGGLWVTYRGGAVCRLEGGRFYPVTNNLPGGQQSSLACDRRGQLWLGKGYEVGTMAGGRFTSLFRVGNSATIIRLAAARSGGLWICAGHELFRMKENGRPQSRGTFVPDQADAQPTALLEDHKGGVWIGTSDSGLFHFDGKKFEEAPTSHGDILCLLEDGEGNLWAGTDGGLDQIQPRVVALENSASGMPFDSLRSICEDAKGVLWAATQNGLLVCQNNGVWSNVSAAADWPGGLASCVTADQSGAVWIGTQNFALYRLQDGKFRVWRAADGLTSRFIHALFAAANGDLWIGGNAPESLQRLREGRLENFKLPHAIGFLRAMAGDTNGNVWMGSTKFVLLRVNAAGAVDVGPQTGSTNSIRSLCVTPDGTLWIGYAGWGLGRVWNGHCATLMSDRGLFDDYISQIVSDGNGWLWFGSGQGIFKVREQELTAAMDNTNARVQSIHYGRDQGLPSLQANFDESPNSWRRRDGRLLFPMSSALAVVAPAGSREVSQPPPVLLNRVLVDDAPAAAYGSVMPVSAGVDLQNPAATLRLPPGHHRVEFDFTALSLTTPGNINFQYRLNGYDDHWIDTVAPRKAVYSRLAAGNYRFEVRARNSDGVWDTKDAALAFGVAPFFWQTWWWRGAGLALTAAILIALVRYVSFRRLQSRVRLLEQQAALDKERARIARDLHDQLGGTLTQTTLQLELALRNGAKPEKTGRHVQQGLTAARQAIKSLDETVWAVNPGNDTLPHLVSYLGEYAVEFLDSAGIRCRLDLPEQLPEQPVSAETRHNLFLAVKEALNNVVRHASASEVRLRARLDDRSLTFTVADNGHGFQVENPGPAPASGNPALHEDGLRNMRQRMEEIGGEFHIESEPGGTRLSFVCPRRNGH